MVLAVVERQAAPAQQAAQGAPAVELPVVPEPLAALLVLPAALPVEAAQGAAPVAAPVTKM